MVFLPRKLGTMATVLITGGRGLIGKALSGLLVQRGYAVIWVGRQTPGVNNEGPAQTGISVVHWDPEKQWINEEAIKQADYIIHLAGTGIADKRWTAKRKKEIVESRTRTGELIVSSLKNTPNKVKAVISASAIGWYGADDSIPPQRPFIETDPADHHFLGETCRRWEESIEPLCTIGIRLVKLRTGIVLSRLGGALPEFIKPLKFGVAAILGNGNQMISWIHMEDLCRMYIDAIENAELQGVFNAVAPNPVNNKRLTLTLAKSLRSGFFIPLQVPALYLSLCWEK
jgi:uncharacterized protein (TIGR01777 family)